jgi:hypothetical protein
MEIIGLMAIGDALPESLSLSFSAAAMIPPLFFLGVAAFGIWLAGPSRTGRGPVDPSARDAADGVLRDCHTGGIRSDARPCQW